MIMGEPVLTVAFLNDIFCSRENVDVFEVPRMNTYFEDDDDDDDDSDDDDEVVQDYTEFPKIASGSYNVVASSQE